MKKSPLDCHICDRPNIRLSKLVKRQTPVNPSQDLAPGQPVFGHFTIYICPKCDLNRPDLALEGPSPVE